MMFEPKYRQETITFVVSEKEKDLIRKNAYMSKKTISEYCRQLALRGYDE